MNTSVPAFPDPWFPLVCVHFYGLNWDLENLPQVEQQQFANAIQQAFPSLAMQVAFDGNYAGDNTQVCLSIGLWSGPLLPQHEAARRRGLLASRSLGKKQGTSEALINYMIIDNAIITGIPETVSLDDDKSQANNGSQANKASNSSGPSLNLDNRSAAVVLPATIHVSATYSTTVPIFGYWPITVSTNVTFGSNNGDLTVTVSDLNAGDFGVGQMILQNLFNPVGMAVLLLGGVGLGLYVVHNLGSNLPALPPLPSLSPPDTLSMLPREIPLGTLKMKLAYLSPTFLTRGASAGTTTGSFLNPGPTVGATPGLFALQIPMTWSIAPRQPTISVTGPTSVGLVGGTGTFAYEAATTDLQNPIFGWSVNGIVRPGKVGAKENLMLAANTQVVGTNKTFVIAATAVDAFEASLQASGSVTAYATVLRPGRPAGADGGREPRGGRSGRWT